MVFSAFTRNGHGSTSDLRSLYFGNERKEKEGKIWNGIAFPLHFLANDRSVYKNYKSQPAK